MTFLPMITGSFSQPAADNPTVAMVEAAYRHHGIDARYLNCEVAPRGLADAVRGARAMGWRGFNCSLPHKVSVIEQLDSLAESARIIGAVNCVVVQDDGRLVGENTDGRGFLTSLAAVRDPAGTDVVVLGAGGAARACAVELALAGAARVRIVNRNPGRGTELAALVGSATAAVAEFIPWAGPFVVGAEVDVLVDATSVGLGDADTLPALDVSTLRPGLVVAGLIPNPPRTALVRAAQAAGCTVVDGLGMLVNQGAHAVRLWTGVDVDPAVMRAAVVRVLDLDQDPDPAAAP